MRNWQFIILNFYSSESLTHKSKFWGTSRSAGDLKIYKKMGKIIKTQYLAFNVYEKWLLILGLFYITEKGLIGLRWGFL